MIFSYPEKKNLVGIPELHEIFRHEMLKLKIKNHLKSSHKVVLVTVKIFNTETLTAH